MDVLLRPIVYIFVFIGGYALKKAGMFKAEDSQVLSKMALNITLPATAINSFAGFTPPTSYFYMGLIGIVCATLPLVIMIFATKKMTLFPRVPLIVNSAGFNIALFALPFMQSLFGSQGAIIACMFDAGNSLIMSGGSYAIVSSALGLDSDNKPTTGEIFVSIFKKLMKCVPFVTYIIVMIILALGIQIPEIASEILTPISSAGGFIAMFMLGIMFEVRLEKQFIKSAFLILGIRLVFSIIFSTIVFFVTAPIFDLQTRQILMLLLFTPCGTFSAVFVKLCNGDEELSSFTVSLTIVVSLIIIFSSASFIIG